MQILAYQSFFYISVFKTAGFESPYLRSYRHRTTLKLDTLFYDNYEDNIFVNYSMKLIYNCIAYGHLQGSK